jgi:hypothetical protein
LSNLKNKTAAAVIVLAVALMFISFVSAYTSSSTSVTNSRYSSLSSSSFEYSSLISGISGIENEEEYYDLMVTILPGGCEPSVVRSDLLEEQNVPIFCELTAVKINPGVDISKIAKISVKKLDNNPLIAGVGFYPARAAISSSSSSLTNSPVANNIGYAVIVLKRTETENAMPDVVSANLSAMFEYNTVNGFGIGVNELYLPVITDDEFANSYKQYSFFNGAGYLRVESMDEDSAVVSVYNSENRRLFSQRLKKDETSREFRIPTSIFSNSYETQAITLTLKEITVPETSAKIMVNDDQYVVYDEGEFADKCKLNEVISGGGGTGSVRITCGGKTVTLEKSFNKIKLVVNGAQADYSIGDKISVLDNQVTQNYYLVYAGNVPNANLVDNKKTFIFLAKEKAGNIMTATKSSQISKNIESQIKAISNNDYYASLGKIKSSSLFSSDELILVYQGDAAKDKENNAIGITFKEAAFENAALTSSSGKTEEYYEKSKKGYDGVESRFPNEINNYISLGNTGETFGTLSLWKKYELAKNLNQEQDALEILSEIRNNYPNSKNIFTESGHNGQTAEQIIANSDNLLSSEGASTFIDDQDLYLELVSVDEPADSEASVEMTYAGLTNSQTTTTPALGTSSVNGEATLKIWEKFSATTSGFSLTVKNITSDKKVNISYFCTGKTEKYKIITESINPIILDDCDVQITISKVNYNSDEKKSNVSLKVEGRKTIKVGEKINELNFRLVGIIKDSSNILTAKVDYVCPSKTGNSVVFKKEDMVEDCNIKITDIREDGITITYKLSSTTSTPQTSSTEIKTGTLSLTARKGEKFVEVGDGKVQITLKSFTEDKAIFTYSCNNSANKDIDIKKGNTEFLPGCDNAQIRVDKINLKAVAKIKLNPNINDRIRETNFSFSIGIEKRSDFLLPSPDEMSKQIKDLDETINQWKNTTEKLGKLVKGMKAACLATSGALTLKNWATGLTGEASARHEVMTRTGGWNDICKEAVSTKEYVSEEQCLLDKNSEIEKSVEETKEIMKKYNDDEEKRITDNKNDKGVTDYNKVKADQLNTLKSSYTGTIEVLGQDGQKKTMPIGDILKNINLSEGDASSNELKELELNLKLMESSVDGNLKNSSSKKVENLLNEFKEKSNQRTADNNIKSENSGLPISFSTNTKTEQREYKNLLWNKDTMKQYGLSLGNGVTINEGSRFAIIPSKNSNVDSTIYLAVLTQGNNNQLTIKPGETYRLVKSGTGYSVDTLSDSDKSNVPTNIVFKTYDSSALKNPCKNCNYVEVFNSEPYKGYPSLLPFDESGGWYISVTQNVASFGSTSSYQDSGTINSFYLCNVGSNGMMEGKLNDDICQNFNINTADSNIEFSGLTASETKTKLTAAQNAIRSAQEQLAKDPSRKTITINRMTLTVKGVQGTTGGKCTDFMSAQDCNIMFNVCDPVVCPSSRCDLGGTYPVDNVIQSGIIGSIVLCLPNFKEGIIVPVCLSGIHAGMEGWISIMQAHRDCLNESLATNRTVGICDEIYSVYQCDFMWKQLGPYANAIAKNALSGTLFGAGSRGGGEYLFVNQAFSNAESSWQYFTSSYASDSSLSFGARSFSEIGSEVCKAQLSATYPDELGDVLEPDSPLQIYASFDESSYSTATVPATSSYKVYYHIFAGNDQGHYYQVYLTSSSSSAIGVSTKGYSNVASGYVAKGETIDETKDFLDNSGFKKLCVRIDTKDYCDFGTVTTDFALNYITDEVVSDQATDEATTEEQCISGTLSLSSLLTTLNLQEGVEGVISPELYNQGIVRVCATKNPGSSVNPSRWSEVGYCGDTNIKCWIDEESVKDAIAGLGIENSTLQELEEMSIEQMIAGGLMNNTAGNNSLNAVIKKYPLLKTSESFTSANYENLNTDVEAIYDKIAFSSQKAALLYYEAMVYDSIARNLFQKQGKSTDVPVTTTTTGESTTTTSNLNQQEGYTIESVTKFLLSYEFIFKDGKQTNFYFGTNDRTNLRYSKSGFDITLFNIESNKFVKNNNFDTYLNELKSVNSEDYDLALGLVGATISGNNIVFASGLDSEVATTANTYDEDTTLLAKMIWSEQRDQGEEAMAVAGWIAVNRLNSNDFQNTLEGVLEGANQFSLNNDFDTTLSGADSDAKNQALEISEEIILNENNVPSQYAGYFFFGNDLASDSVLVSEKMLNCAAVDADFVYEQISDTTMYVSNKDYSNC